MFGSRTYLGYWTATQYFLKNTILKKQKKKLTLKMQTSPGRRHQQTPEKVFTFGYGAENENKICSIK